MKYIILIIFIGNIAQARFNEDLSFQTYQSTETSLSLSGEVKYSFPKSNFALNTGFLCWAYGISTYSPNPDWSYSVGTTYEVGTHLTLNADYIYKTIDQNYMIYELDNSPSVVRMGMTLHF